MFYVIGNEGRFTIMTHFEGQSTIVKTKLFTQKMHFLQPKEKRRVPIRAIAKLPIPDENPYIASQKKTATQRATPFGVDNF